VSEIGYPFQALTEAEFVAKLQEEGLELRTIAGDGNCMFRTVADQVYGDEEMHEQVRACCLDYMVRSLL
jgi:OTU domain-containing protein 5